MYKRRTYNLKVTCSKSSALRFINLVTGLKDTPYWFHQTLTFGEDIQNPTEAKDRLRNLLDSLHKSVKRKYDMATIFVMGRQMKKRIHFHVLFLMYSNINAQPETVREYLSAEVWKRWKALNPTAVRKGNRMNIQKKAGAIPYLLGMHFRIGKTKKEAGKQSWNGIRNASLIAQNSSPVSAQDCRTILRNVYLTKEERSARDQVTAEDRAVSEFGRIENGAVEKVVVPNWDFGIDAELRREAEATDFEVIDYFKPRIEADCPVALDADYIDF